MSDKHPGTKKYVKTITGIMLVSVLLELVFFNFRSIQSLFLTEKEYPLDEIYAEGMLYDGDCYYLTEETAVVYLTDLPEKTDGRGVHNVRLDIELPDSQDLPFMESGVLRLWPYLQDEGHERYCALTEHIYREDIPQSSWLALHGSGEIRSIAFQLSLSNGNAVRLKQIVLNAHRPFYFSVVRFLMMFIAGVVVYAFRGRSDLWKSVQEVPGWKKRGIVMLLAVILILPAVILIGKNIYLNEYTFFRPYQKLAERLLAGEVSLQETPPQWLTEMENPYDDTLRTVLAEESGEDFLWDYAYYNGKYYVYFGILPCLIFYLPFYLLTGTHISNAVPVVLCAVMLFAGFYFLFRVLADRIGRIPYGIVLILNVFSYLGAQMPFFMNQPDAYAVPVALGEVLIVWGLVFWCMAGKEMPSGAEETKGGRRMYVCLGAGSLCMALVAASRPNMLVYGILAIPLFWIERSKMETLWKKQRREVLRGGIIFVIPYLLVAAGVMYYNYVRFSNPFDFGFAYNLTVHDMTRTIWSFDKLLIGIWEYMLKLPDLSMKFPYLSIPGDGVEYNAFGHTVVHMEYIFGGLLACNPQTWLISVLFDVKKKETEERKWILFARIAAVLGICVMLLDAQMAGVVYRYMADFSPVLLLAAAISVMLLWKRLEKDGDLALLKGFLVFCAVVVLGFHCNFYWLTGLKYPLLWGDTGLYYRIYYAMMFW